VGPNARAVVTDAGLSRLVTALDALKTVRKGGVFACPADLGPTFALFFNYSVTRMLIVIVPSSGCRFAVNGILTAKTDPAVVSLVRHLVMETPSTAGAAASRWLDEVGIYAAGLEHFYEHDTSFGPSPDLPIIYLFDQAVPTPRYPEPDPMSGTRLPARVVRGIRVSLRDMPRIDVIDDVGSVIQPVGTVRDGGVVIVLGPISREDGSAEISISLYAGNVGRGCRDVHAHLGDGGMGRHPFDGRERRRMTLIAARSGALAVADPHTPVDRGHPGLDRRGRGERPSKLAVGSSAGG
jgi:hypothetical protein